MIPGLGFLGGVFAWFRNSALGRGIALALSVVVGILTMRAIWRGDAKRDARREMREQSNEAALERMEKRDEIDRDVADGGSRERLLRHWSRDAD